jgi:hypothetical protein
MKWCNHCHHSLKIKTYILKNKQWIYQDNQANKYKLKHAGEKAFTLYNIKNNGKMILKRNYFVRLRTLSKK